MKHIDEYRASDIAKDLIHRIREISHRPVRLMEVCGTHTVSIFRNGIRSVLPDTISLLSGPGCPVCVTAQGEIDAMIALAAGEDVIIATFGDLLKVPGTHLSLLSARSEGMDIRVVYSPDDAVAMAAADPLKKVVFLGIGFETTAPAVACAVLSAQEKGLSNFSVFSAHKRVPPVLAALMSNRELNIDGFILPGHVSMVIGEAAYTPLYLQYRLPMVIAGFEPVDILSAVLLLISQIESGNPKLENAYRRAVLYDGNREARQMIRQVFDVTEATWRGIGRIEESGLALKDAFASFDATKQFGIEIPKYEEIRGCDCGKILQGLIMPPQCSLFGSVCTPLHPVGPCMVAGEGTCGAYYRYAEESCG